MLNDIQKKVLREASKLFLTIGYEKTSIRMLEKNTNVNYGSIMYAFENKENLVSSLVGFVLEAQFEYASRLVANETDNLIFLYVTETVLQLYLAETNEHMREMYNVSYSLPSSTKKVHNTVTAKLEYIFKNSLPNYDTKDFYCLELAASGIMRSYLNRQCDMFFTMDLKVEKFIEVLLLIYRVPDKTIKEAINYIKQFDFKTIAQEFILNMPKYFEEKLS